MPRLFVAIELPERIKEDLQDTYFAMPGARWMDNEHLHITMRFIGDLRSDRAMRVVPALRQVSVSPFSLQVKGVGFFPPRREPRILWAGLRASDELLRLQTKIERVLTAAGIEPEGRKFHPHITVARLSGTPESKVAQYITLNSLLATEPFMVSAFHLYASTLHRDGSHYVVEESFSLKAEITDSRF